MYCPECGKKMEEGASFCSYCGTRVLMIENDADDRDFSSGETRIFGEGPKNSGDEHIPGTAEEGDPGYGNGDPYKDYRSGTYGGYTFDDVSSDANETKNTEC